MPLPQRRAAPGGAQPKAQPTGACEASPREPVELEREVPEQQSQGSQGLRGLLDETNPKALPIPCTTRLLEENELHGAKEQVNILLLEHEDRSFEARCRRKAWYNFQTT